MGEVYQNKLIISNVVFMVERGYVLGSVAFRIDRKHERLKVRNVSDVMF